MWTMSRDSHLAKIGWHAVAPKTTLRGIRGRSLAPADRVADSISRFSIWLARFDLGMAYRFLPSISLFFLPFRQRLPDLGALLEPLGL